MTDRLKGCTVSFTAPVREDDADAILDAIRMIRGVDAVLPVLDAPEDWHAYQRARRELSAKLWRALKGEA
jgi:hypothetical protein